MPKPSGISGFFGVGFDEKGHISGRFEQTAFSPEKADIEKQMTVSFLAAMNKYCASPDETFPLSNPKQNQENDLDFSIESPNGPAYLELMEIAPLKGPYKTAPPSYRPYDFAKAVLGGIHAKSRHYVGIQGRDLYLLLYVTHWAFTPSDSVLNCLRYWLARETHVFRGVFMFYMLDSLEGAPYFLFPFPPDPLASFDPEAIRDNVCLNLDPQKFELRTDS